MPPSSGRKCPNILSLGDRYISGVVTHLAPSGVIVHNDPEWLTRNMMYPYPRASAAG